MKVAVVGGGSTYTPELVDGFARLRDAAAGRRAVLVDPAADRLDARRRHVAERMLRARRATPAGSLATDRPRRGRRRRRRRAAPAAGRRAGGPERGRDAAAGVRLRRAGDHRRRRAGQGAAHRAGRARHRRAGRASAPRRTPGSSTSPTRSASSPGRCSRPATARSGCATSRSASSAGSPRMLGVDPVAVVARPRRPQPPHLGARASPWTASDVLPELLGRARRRARRRRRPAAGRSLRTLGVVPVLLPALLLRARRRGRRAARPADPRAAGSRRSSASCSSCTPTRRWTPSRRCSSERGGAFYSEAAVDLLPRWSATAATSRWSTSATTAPCRSCPTTRVIEVPAPGRRAGGAAPLPVEPLDPLLRRTDRARRRRTSSSRSTPRCTAAATGCTARCSRTRWSASTTLAARLTDLLLAANRAHLAWARRDRRGRSPSTAATARPTSRWSARTARVLGAPPRAGLLPADIGVRRRPCTCSPSSSRRGRAQAGLDPAGRSPTHVRGLPGRCRPAGRGATMLPRRGRSPAAGPATSSSTTTPSRCCGRAPSTATRSPWSAARASTASGVSAAGGVARFPALGPDLRRLGRRRELGEEALWHGRARRGRPRPGRPR